MELLLGGTLHARQQIRHEHSTGCESIRISSFYGRAFEAAGASGASTKAGHIPFAMLFILVLDTTFIFDNDMRADVGYCILQGVMLKGMLSGSMEGDV